MKLEEAHKIAEKLEKEIKNEMDIDATIHMEPIIPIKR
jgi:divalent metal cation (Fe/Co/Zn/Cd) transporter